MTIGDGVILAFVIFNCLLLLLAWWGLRAGQKALDRRFEEDDRAWQEAMKRWPP